MAQVRKLVRKESPVLLAQVETALTSTNGGSETTHFLARVETADELDGEYYETFAFPRARGNRRMDTYSKPVSAAG